MSAAPGISREALLAQLRNAVGAAHVLTDDQAETDRYWDAIVGTGGAESQCGWCKDAFGLSWQVVPDNMDELMSRPGAYEAMMQMGKLEIAKF